MIIYTVPKILSVLSSRSFQSFWVRFHQVSEASYQNQTEKIVENDLRNLEVNIILNSWSTVIKNSDLISPNLCHVAQRKTMRSIWSSDSGHEKFYGSKRPIERFSAKVIVRVTDQL